MDPISQLVDLVLGLISSAGYPGIFLAMTMESALLPIPSEIIMSFSGFLAASGTFNFWLVVLVGTLGDLAGAWIAYVLGIRVGRAAILKYGKYIMLREHHLIKAETWFKRHGDKTIFLSRMTPVVRTVISLPAGVSRMDAKKFSSYTFFGSVPWNLTLAYLGYLLGANWSVVKGYGSIMDLLVVVGAAAAISAYLISKNRKVVSKAFGLAYKRKKGERI